jgi:hypothetical protein
MFKFNNNMTTTDSFQIKPDYFKSKEECDNHKYDKYNTNPRYKNFCQTHFTAGDEEQFRKYAVVESKPDYVFKYISSNNVFRDYNFDVWEKNKNVNEDTMLNTFRYIFYKFKKGIFVKIINNELKVFLPFSNVNYRNEWDKLIDTKDILSILRKSYEGQKYVFKDKYINKFSDEWYANNSILRMEYPISEKDTNVCIYKDMLTELCKKRKIPDVEFFLNRRDNPLLTKNLCEPYNHIWGDNKSLVSHKYDKYIPIMSMSKQDNHADLLFPTYNDWARVQQRKNKWFVDDCSEIKQSNILWENKKQTAVFRGSTTGTGICEQTNMRIKAAYISETDINRKKLFLDAGITKWNCRPRKVKGNNKLQVLDTNKQYIKLKNYLTYTEQCNYKYVLHIQGHVEAFRLSLELSMNCVILLVESKWKLWYSDMLKPYEHYIPVKHDLSNLFEVIQWCRNNDDRCKIVAQNALVFYNKYLNNNAILDYTQKLLYDISKYMCKPPVINKSKTITEYRLNNVLQFQKNKYNYDVEDLDIPVKFSEYYSFHKCLSMLISSFFFHIKFLCNIFKTKQTCVCKNVFFGNLITIKKAIVADKRIEYIQEAFVGYNCTNVLKRDIPNFYYIYHMKAENDAYTLVTEYIDGITLHEYLLSENFDILVLLNVFTQLYYALQIAKDKYGFIHYDLTPWNIILKRQNKPVSIQYKLHDRIQIVTSIKFIAVMIDYGKSKITKNNIRHELLENCNNYYEQDMMTLIFTSTKKVLKRSIDKYTMNICFQLVNCFVYDKLKTVYQLKKFVFYNAKYSVLVFQRVHNIKNDCTTDIQRLLHKHCNMSLTNIYTPYIKGGLGVYMFHSCFKNNRFKKKLYNKVLKILSNNKLSIDVRDDIQDFIKVI